MSRSDRLSLLLADDAIYRAVLSELESRVAEVDETFAQAAKTAVMRAGTDPATMVQAQILYGKSQGLRELLTDVAGLAQKRGVK